jgi:hypothetical protein
MNDFERATVRNQISLDVLIKSSFFHYTMPAFSKAQPGRSCEGKPKNEQIVPRGFVPPDLQPSPTP